MICAAPSDITSSSSRELQRRRGCKGATRPPPGMAVHGIFKSKGGPRKWWGFLNQIAFLRSERGVFFNQGWTNPGVFFTVCSRPCACFVPPLAGPSTGKNRSCGWHRTNQCRLKSSYCPLTRACQSPLESLYCQQRGLWRSRAATTDSRLASRWTEDCHRCWHAETRHLAAPPPLFLPAVLACQVGPCQRPQRSCQRTPFESVCALCLRCRNRTP